MCVFEDQTLASLRSLRTVRALRPLRAVSRLEGMKVKKTQTKILQIFHHNEKDQNQIEE